MISNEIILQDQENKIRNEKDQIQQLDLLQQI